MKVKQSHRLGQFRATCMSSVYPINFSMLQSIVYCRKFYNITRAMEHKWWEKYWRKAFSQWQSNFHWGIQGLVKKYLKSKCTWMYMKINFLTVEWKYYYVMKYSLSKRRIKYFINGFLKDDKFLPCFVLLNWYCMHSADLFI